MNPRTNCSEPAAFRLENDNLENNGTAPVESIGSPAPHPYFQQPAGSFRTGANRFLRVSTWVILLLLLAGGAVEALLAQAVKFVPTITTVAGVAQTGGYNGDNIQATTAKLNMLLGMAVDAAGNLYIADTSNDAVRRVDAATGIITTVAGIPGTAGYNGDNIQANTAELSYPTNVAVDAAGNLYIADYGNNCIREVATSGNITTIAGTCGTAGVSGDNGPATGAQFNAPIGIALDSVGHVYVADAVNNRIREFTVGGNITTIAGSAPASCAGQTDAVYDGCPAIQAQLKTPEGVAVDAAGNVFVADYANNLVREITSDGIIHAVAGNYSLGAGFSGDGGPATAAALNSPFAILPDGAGNIYVSDSVNGRVRKFTVGGNITTVAGSGTGYTADGGAAVSALMNNPGGLALAPDGNLYVAEYGNDIVRKVNVSGITSFPATSVGSVSTAQNVFVQLPGTTPPAIAAAAGFTDFSAGSSTCNPNSAGELCSVAVTFAPKVPGRRGGPLQVTASGNTYLFALTGVGNGPATALDPGTRATLASGTNYLPTGVALDAAGNAYVVEAGSNSVLKMPAGGGASTVVASGLNNPAGVAVDAAGNVYIANTGGSNVLKIAPGGVQTPVGTGLSSPFGVAVDAADNLYIADYGLNEVIEVPAAGGAQKVLASGFSNPQGIAVDASGNVFVADTGNKRVVEIPADGSAQKIVASGLNFPPTAVALDAAANLYLADNQDGLVVELPSAGGSPVTVANGLSTAGFYGIALDTAGNVYVGDAGNHQLLKMNRSNAATLAFHSTSIGMTSSDSPRAVFATNIGNRTLTLSSLASTANFAIDASATTCSVSAPVALGTSCAIGVDFTPLAIGNLTGTASLVDDALNAAGSTQAVSLTGTGLATATQLAFATPPASPISAGGSIGAVTVNVEASNGAVDGTSTASVTLTLTGPAGFKTQTFNATAASGVASFNLTSALDRAGTYTLSASSVGLASTAPATVTVTALTTASALAVAYPSQVYASAPHNTTVTAEDQFGNVITGFTGTVALTSSDAQAALNPASYTYTSTDNGKHIFQVTLNTVGTQTITATSGTIVGTKTHITVNAIPAYAVTTIADDATGAGANCPAGGTGASCSLRDAVAAVNATATGTITFASSLTSGGAATIILANGPVKLNAAGALTITGPGAKLLSISGNGSTSILQATTAVTNATISGLTFTNGKAGSNGAGGGIYNQGTLTLSESAVSGNAIVSGVGGGIYNRGKLTVANSTISGNTAGVSGLGGGIYNSGTLTVTNSTITGNTAGKNGGGIFNRTTLVANNITIAGNSASLRGGGIFNSGTVTAANSIVAGNTSSIANDDCLSCGTQNSFNLIGTTVNPITAAQINLAPLGYYGGATQTMPPLPGSMAISAGSATLVPAGVITDQRGAGFARVLSNRVDLGAVETNYSLVFSTQPPAQVNVNATFAATVQLDESGQPFAIGGISIPMALSAGDPRVLSGGTAATGTNGAAAYSNLAVSAPGSGDTLAATLALTASSVTPALSATATSGKFNVGQIAQTITFHPLPNIVYAAQSVSLVATSDSGLPVTFTLVSGPATLTGNVLAITGTGTVVVDAVQNGNVNYMAATPVQQGFQVTAGQPILTWVPAAAQGGYGTPLGAGVLNASVAGGVQGSITYNAQMAGGPIQPVAAASTLAAGTYTLTATFTPANPGYLSASKSMAFVVSQATLTAMANNATRVYGASNPQFTGAVSGAINGDSFAESFSTVAQQTSYAGTYPIVPVVTGAHLADYAVAPVNGTLTVTQAASKLALTATANTIAISDPVTFTATATSTTAGMPTGTVTFLNGTTQLGVASLNPDGVATLRAYLTLGTNAISAQYSGDSNFTGSQAQLAGPIVAGTAGFSLSAAPNSLTTIEGKTTGTSLTLTPQYFFSGTVNLSCSGLPKGAACIFGPTAVSFNGNNQPLTSQLTITTWGVAGTTTASNAGPSAPVMAGLFWLPVMFLGGFLGFERKQLRAGTRQVLMMLIVVAGLVSLAGGLTGCANLSPTAPEGAYTITVTATSGAVTQTENISLTITK